MRGQDIILSNINEDSKILDVSGAFFPFALATHVIDVMPWLYAKNRPSWLEDRQKRFSESSYNSMDICDGKWPFKDKEFDFVVCSQVLKDV